MTYMILIANSIVKQSKRQKAGKLYLWILITTYYLLSKNWDIFATRCCILLIFNHNYFRGGQMTPIGKDITKRNKIACNSTSYTLFVFYALMFAMSLLCPYLSHFCNIHVTRLNLRQDATYLYLLVLIHT